MIIEKYLKVLHHQTLPYSEYKNFSSKAERYILGVKCINLDLLNLPRGNSND